MENTALLNTRTDDGAELRVVLTQAPRSYCSFVPANEDERKMLFNAMNSPQERLADHINETIEIKDIFAEECEFVNEETGDITPGMRIVFISKDNVSYACASMGIWSAIKKLIQIYNEPTWEPALPLKVKQIKKNKKSILTLEF